MTSTANIRQQQTLAAPIKLTGPGLFHGIRANLRLLPAEENTGIRVRRTDLDTPEIPARHDYVLSATRRTVLGVAETTIIETTEHLMAALAGLQVDNCLIELNAPEVPSFDASSRVFCDAILECGLVRQSTPAATLTVENRLTASGPGKESLVLRPYQKPLMAVTWHLDYGARSPVLPQVYSAELTPEIFVREIAAARTFVLEAEIKALQRLGYGKHLTDADLLVCGTDGIWNNRLRWSNECVRHKLLDCIGDLALSGLSIQGHITAIRSGHKLNHQLAATVATENQEDTLMSAAA